MEPKKNEIDTSLAAVLRRASEEMDRAPAWLRQLRDQNEPLDRQRAERWEGKPSRADDGHR
jgi:hypothetical protein